jgi:septation ring formation regulator EzrA
LDYTITSLSERNILVKQILQYSRRYYRYEFCQEFHQADLGIQYFEYSGAYHQTYEADGKKVNELDYDPLRFFKVEF